MFVEEQRDSSMMRVAAEPAVPILLVRRSKVTRALKSFHPGSLNQAGDGAAQQMIQTNQRFGRRFIVTSVRWLGHDEV